MPPATELRVRVGETTGDVSALLVRPADARFLYVLAHGAGAGMRHPFLEAISQRLAEQGIATLRDQFPYMEQRARRPHPPPLAGGAGPAPGVGGGPAGPGAPPLRRGEGVRG